MNKLVSIITVCLNSEKTIERTIKSVLRQTYKNIEYIIIDGASTDGTMDIINKYRDGIAVVVSEPDDGLYYAMNKGIRSASGNIIGIINSDDWYEVDAVEKIVKGFEKGDFGIVFGGVSSFGKDDKEISREVGIKYLWRGMYIDHPGVFVDAEIYKRYGLFDTQYRICADYDFVYKAIWGGTLVGEIPNKVANFSLTGISSICLEQNKGERESIAYKYLKQELLSTAVGEIIEDKCKIAIWGAGLWGIQLIRTFRQIDDIELQIIDSDEKKINREIESVVVESPSNIRNDIQILIVAIEDKEISREMAGSLGDGHSFEIVELREIIERCSDYFMKKINYCYLG